jgi:hypothetical protein
MNPVTTAMVTAIRRQQPHGVLAELLEIDSVRTEKKLGMISDFSRDYNFKFISCLFD